MNNLPKNLLHTMIGLKFKTSHFYDLEEYMIKMAGMLDYQRVVRESLATIVKRASIRQSAKGVFTAGLLKTVKYSWRKLAKMFN
jgi:translocator assembly and maintenance protein 41